MRPGGVECLTYGHTVIRWVDIKDEGLHNGVGNQRRKHEEQ